MIKTINVYDFRQAFRNYEDRRDTFSYGALESIFDYLEDTEDETNPTELDVISVCCDFTEYDNAWDAMMQYQPEDMPVEGVEGDDLLEIAEKNEQAALEWLQERTTVLDVENINLEAPLMAPMLTSIVIANF